MSIKVHHPCHSDEQVNVIVHFPQSDSTGNSGPCMSQGQLRMSKLMEQSSILEFCSHSKMAEKKWGGSNAVNINEVNSQLI